MSEPIGIIDRTKRSRISFEVAARHATAIVRPAVTVRIVALAVALTVIVQQEQLVPILLCLPAVAICLIRIWTPVGSSAGRPPGGDASPDSRRHWILGSWWDLASALLVIAVAAWGTVSLPASSRFLAIAAAVVLLTVVATRACLDPRWYRADPAPRPVARLLRAAAGPLGLVSSMAVALPAPWPPGQRATVVVICLLALANVPLTRDQNLTVRGVVEMIRTEAQDGRQSVLDELHGNLSANLRLLEQASLELRDASPRLYELAVGANSRLRETLTLADPAVDSAAEPQTLVALVRTLALAVGARAELTIEPARLAEVDRDLLRLVLNDVVRVVLGDGASQVSAGVRVVGGVLTVGVVGGGSAGPDRLGRLGPLRDRLDDVGGSVTAEAVSAADGRAGIVVRWPAAAGTG